MSFDACMPSGCGALPTDEDPIMFGQTMKAIMKDELESGPQERQRLPSMEFLSPGHHSAERSASAVGCVFAMLATIVGGGALSLPYALKSLGAGPGFALIFLAAYASDASLLALCAASRRTGIVALPRLARHTHGPWLEVVCNASLLALCGFVSVAYVTLLRDMLEVIGFEEGGDLNASLGACLVCVLFPLSLFEDVSRLSFAAVVSFGAAVLVAATFCIRAPAALAGGIRQIPYFFVVKVTKSPG